MLVISQQVLKRKRTFRHIDISVSYRETSSISDIAHGVVMWAAAVMVSAAGGCLERATSPGEAMAAISVDATASAALWAGITLIANCRRLQRRRRRRRARVWWIWLRFYRIRCFHCDTTFACSILNVTFHSNEAGFSPILSP